MTPARELWSKAVGFLPHKVTVYENAERNGVLYLRWRQGGNWRKTSLQRPLRTPRGKIDPDTQSWALEQAAQKYARLVAGLPEKAIEYEERRLAERRRSILRDVERRKEYLRLQMQRLGKLKVVGRLCTVTLHGNSTLSVSSLSPSTTGPQSDLFARGRGHHQRRGERGQHIRVR